MWVIDRDARTSFVNPRMAEMLGYAVDEMVGTHLFSFMDERGVEICEQQLGRRAQGIKEQHEFEFLRKDGTRLYASLQTAPITDDEGSYAGAIAGVVDISERRRLERDILRIGDREQQRMGQDLHDGLCQHLRGVALMSEMLEAKLRTREVPETDDAARITQLITEGVTQARRLVTGLSPVSPAPNGLMSALEALATTTEDLFGIPCAFTCAMPVLVDDAAIANHLYRIAQEAVNNAVKHSGGRRVLIDLTKHDGTIELTVRDDGVGLDSGVEHPQGMGLRIMAFRARMIDASLEILRGHERGTIVRCSVSLPTSESPGR